MFSYIYFKVEVLGTDTTYNLTNIRYIIFKSYHYICIIFSLVYFNFEVLGTDTTYNLKHRDIIYFGPQSGDTISLVSRAHT